MTLRSDLELGVKIRIIVAMVRRVPAQRADREIERIERQIAGKDRGRPFPVADEVRYLNRLFRPDELGAFDVDDHQAGRKAVFSQILCVEQVFGRVAVRNG
jgi:hypothetical protein